MRDVMAQAVSAIAFGVSFFLLWLTFATLWFGIVIRLFRNEDGEYVFGLKKKSAPKAIDAVTKAGSSYFATKLGRLHGIVLGSLIITTVLLGFWALIVNKSHSAPVDLHRTLVSVED